MANLINRPTPPPTPDGQQPQPEVVRMLWSRYADGMYDLALRLLYDRDAAVDLVQRAFDSLGNQPRSPDVSLRAALLARTRRLALDHLVMRPDLRTARQRSLSRPPWTETIDRSRLLDPQMAETAGELATDIWIAAASLPPADYSLLDLYARKDLSRATIAAATAQPETTLNVILDRLEADLRRATADQLLLRFGPLECASLKTEVGRRPTSILSPELRARVSGHVRACARCRRNWQEFGTAADFFSALATLPLPSPLREQMFSPPPAVTAPPAPAAAPTAPPSAAPAPRITLLNVEPRRPSPRQRLLATMRAMPAFLLIPLAGIVVAAGLWFALGDRPHPAEVPASIQAPAGDQGTGRAPTLPPLTGTAVAELTESPTATPQPVGTPLPTATGAPPAPAAATQTPPLTPLAQPRGTTEQTASSGPTDPRAAATAEPPASPPTPAAPRPSAPEPTPSLAPAVPLTTPSPTTLITTLPLPPVPSPQPAAPQPSPSPQPALIPGQVVATPTQPPLIPGTVITSGTPPTQASATPTPRRENRSPWFPSPFTGN